MKLTIKNLKKELVRPTSLLQSAKNIISGKAQKFWVIDDVSLEVCEQESLGLVGESGCGKTTLGRTILRLIPQVDGGKILFDSDRFSTGENSIFDLSEEELKEYRKNVQMIFQNPEIDFNPAVKAEKSIREAIELNSSLSKSEVNDQIEFYLNIVNLNYGDLNKYPHQLSGGEKRRIGVIRALAIKPKLIVADEPFAGLDVSIRNQLINIFVEQQMKEKLSFIIISHEIGIVKRLCSRFAVMYLGKIIEIADSSMLTPVKSKHPYTLGLLAASWFLGSLKGRPMREEDFYILKYLSDEISIDRLYRGGKRGCVFRDRCFAYHDAEKFTANERKLCEEAEPPLVEIEPNHKVACHYWDRAGARSTSWLERFYESNPST